ncbi:MAG: hypothetical protein ACI379_11095 [Nocardioides sp.]|uniref:hypothetical protein n=1 Tax=Nocardioides sp. TaxID=35761 RepID=UPI003F0DF64C
MRTLVTCLLALLAMAGCAPPSGSEAAPARPVRADDPSAVDAAPAGEVQVAWTAPAVVQGPWEVGGVVVTVEGAQAQGYRVVGRSVDDGREIWRHATVPEGSFFSFGAVGATDREGDEHVVVQEEVGVDGFVSVLAVLDPRTGEVQGRVRPQPSELGTICPGDVDLCFRGWERGWTRWDLRDLSSQRLTARSPRGTRVTSLATGVYANDFPAERLRVGRRDGSVRWEVALDDLVHGRWWLSNTTAFVRVDDELGLVLVPIFETLRIHDGLQRRYDAGRRVPVPVTARGVVALDLDTGQEVWRSLGIGRECAGTEHVGRPVRCRYAGTALRRKGGTTLYRGMEEVMEGYDPTTGATVWEIPLADALADERYGETSVNPGILGDIVDGDEFTLAMGRDEPLLVALVDGSTRSLPAGTTTLCRATRPLVSGAALDNPFSDSIPTARYVRACGFDGSPGGGRPSAEALFALTERIGEEVWAVAEKRRLVAYRVVS